MSSSYCLEELKTPEDANQIAAELMKAIGAPIRLRSQDHRLAASIGISIYPRDGNNQDGLLRHADQAMYRAKKSGGGNRAAIR